MQQHNSVSAQRAQIKVNSWSIDTYYLSAFYNPSSKSIYINVFSYLTEQSWSGIVNNSTTLMDLNKFFTLMTKCFNKKKKSEFETDTDTKTDGGTNSNLIFALEINSSDSTNLIKHDIIWNIFEHTMIIIFSTKLYDVIDIEERIYLQEIIFPIVSIQQIQQVQQIQEVQQVQQVQEAKPARPSQPNYSEELIQLNKLVNEPIMFASHPTIFGLNFSCKPNSDLIDFTEADGFLFHGNYLDLNKLKQLKKIILFVKDLYYSRTLNDWFSDSSNNYSNCVIGCSDSDSNNWQNSLKNVFDCTQIYLPSVKSIVIRYQDYVIFPTQFNSLPNLTELTFESFGDIPFNSIDLIKNIPNLNRLIYWECNAIEEFDLIVGWCDDNQIELILK